MEYHHIEIDVFDHEQLFLMLTSPLSMIVRFLADLPSTADEHTIWKTPYSLLVYLCMCPSVYQ